MILHLAQCIQRDDKLSSTITIHRVRVFGVVTGSSVWCNQLMQVKVESSRNLRLAIQTGVSMSQAMQSFENIAGVETIRKLMVCRLTIDPRSIPTLCFQSVLNSIHCHLAPI